MAGNGFSDFRDPRVFANGSTVFYGVGNVDGRNACAPFRVSGERAALVEGPAIVGLSLMAREWSAPGGVTAAQGPIPVGTIHRDQGAQLGTSFPHPYVYKTMAGQVALHYQINGQYPHGRISVVTQRDDGTPLQSQTFELREG